MRLDKKFLLIAPTIVLAFLAAGMIYATLQLRALRDVGNTWKDRNDFVSAVERGEKTLEQRQALNILRYSLDVEAKRTEAVAAAEELLVVLSSIGVLTFIGLALAVRAVPRETVGGHERR